MTGTLISPDEQQIIRVEQIGMHQDEFGPLDA